RRGPALPIRRARWCSLSTLTIGASTSYSHDWQKAGIEKSPRLARGRNLERVLWPLISTQRTACPTALQPNFGILPDTVFARQYKEHRSCLVRGYGRYERVERHSKKLNTNGNSC